MAKVFIDGSSGTTGLRIHERLADRNDIELIILDEEHRKNNDSVREALKQADIAFLCLPDEAAREAAAMADESTVIIDTSTAHRVSDGWAYGFPELLSKRAEIASSKRIANPGCHASGFISLVEPLVKNNIINKDALLSCFSLTGYSGGGKKMIADYNDENRKKQLEAPRMYGITQNHKHLPEMSAVCGLKNPPVFCPIVSSYYAGMEVTVPVFASEINGTVNDIKEVYKSYYTGKLVRFREFTDENGFVSSASFEGRDDMEISVYGNDERILLVSRFDNLGKGASGSAIQNMNIVLGIDETTGLVFSEE